MFRFQQRPKEGIDDFAAAPNEVRDRATSPLGDMFFAHKGRLVHKWVEFLDLYDRYFSQWRGTDLVFLEIGVSGGGSLELWRNYFGPKAVICGIDIDPGCARHVDAPNLVRIGSQDDPEFLASVIAEIGKPHIVLDDGSHVGRHQRASFDSLWPELRTGGIYAIEDLHTSYWPVWEGGYRRNGTGVEMVKGLIDDQHGWFHDKGRIPPEQIGGIHQHESIVFIEKANLPRPAHVQVSTG